MRKSLMGLVLAGGLAIASLSACGSDNFRDVEGVHSHNAENYFVFNNVDGNPNMVIACLPGHFAYMTTTREYQAVVRQPEFDPMCAATPLHSTINPTK